MKVQFKVIAFFIIIFPVSGEFYAGAGALGTVLSGNQTLLIRSTTTGIMPFKNYGLRDTSISAETFAGYGLTLTDIYMGLEFVYSFLKSKSEFRSHIAGDKEELLTTKIGDGYGSAMRLGYWLSQKALVYVRLGWESRKITINFHDDDGDLISVRKDYRAHALVPGLGAEMKITPKWAFRMEAKGAFYPNKHFSVVSNSANYTNIKTRPRLYSFMLGLVYVF